MASGQWSLSPVSPRKTQSSDLPRKRTPEEFAEVVRRKDARDEMQNQASLDEDLSTLSITSDSESQTFDTFPNFPAEIRLHIFSHAILDLPSRIIPIREITGKKSTPAYFTTSRPHCLFSTISREAREAVFSTLQPLFLAEGGHMFATVNMEKDIILFHSDNGKLRPKSLKRLQKAMGPRSEHPLQLAIQIQIEQRGNYYVPNPEYGVIASLTEIFPLIRHLTIVPVEYVSLHGVGRYRGELCFGTEEEFEGRVKNYYALVNKEEYERSRPYQMVWDAEKQKAVKRPGGLEIRWACLKLVGGEMFRDWDQERIGFWRLKREGDDEHKLIILQPRN